MRVKINESNYEDIYDGLVYKSLPETYTQNRNYITFSWNSDGVFLFISSKVSIRPLYLVINELSPELRFKKENAILAGLWFGQ